MEIKITDAASKWLISELNLQDGDGVKFFAASDKIPAEHGPKQGYAKDNHPDRPIYSIQKDGINYHINFDDDWFFSNLVTTIDYNDNDGLTFSFAGGPDTVAGASINYEKYLM